MKVSKVKTKNRWNGKQRRIGITGGIASGKSSIAKYLANTKNIPILDADLFAREAMDKETNIRMQVLDRYGDIIIRTENDDNKKINRFELGQIIFSDKKEKLWIESLIHPYVKKRFDIELSKHQNSNILGLVIPLLFEAGLNNICSEIWLIYCTTAQQYRRLKQRDNFNHHQAKLRVDAQLPMDYKKQISDEIIDNSQSLQASYNQIDKLLN